MADTSVQGLPVRAGSPERPSPKDLEFRPFMKQAAEPNNREAHQGSLTAGPGAPDTSRAKTVKSLGHATKRLISPSEAHSRKPAGPFHLECGDGVRVEWKI